jgi:hypothetical protein
VYIDVPAGRPFNLGVIYAAAAGDTLVSIGRRCVFACACLRVRVCVCVRARTRGCVYARVWDRRACVCGCVCMRVSGIGGRVCAGVCVCVCLGSASVCVRVCVYACVWNWRAARMERCVTGTEPVRDRGARRRGREGVVEWKGTRRGGK